MRPIITAREQHALRQHWLTAADDLGTNTGTETSSSTGCDPLVPGSCPDASRPGDGASSTINPNHPQISGDGRESDPGFAMGGDHYAPNSGFGGASSSGSASSSSSPSSSAASPASYSTSTPGGGAPSQGLTEALTRAGIDPQMFPLISGFAATEGNNPSGAPTLGFTDSQAGSSLDGHAQALAKQLQDRQSVAGPFKPTATPAEQASWMATVVGQNGVSSDWQGNAQPARSDYVNRIVKSMPPPPPVQTSVPSTKVGRRY